MISRTINRFTLLDAYPLPQIDEIVTELSKFKVFTTIDLKSAYHQIELDPLDREYTAFQSGSQLYQWRRLPFGLTNAVPEFQRAINSFVENNNLKCCFPYLDDITIAGVDQADHDHNLKAFYEAAAKWHLNINEQKTQLSKNGIALLGYRVTYQTIKPDPDRVQPLLKMPVPKASKDLQRLIGLFAYYARWIPNYSDHIRPLIQSSSFPLDNDVVAAIEKLKQILASAALHPINGNLPLVVEADAPDFAIAATLNQNGRPVAFHSRTLSASEQKHTAVEKEAYAVVEALRKWRHLLLGRHFTLLTDQKSVSYMFDTRHANKIKNDKILRWRIELSSFYFTVVHRPGKENVGADTLSRAFCGAVTVNRLRELHIALCHPGVTRMAHFVRTKNLPYALADIREMTANCKECLEIKPQFAKTETTTLIKATRPFERLNLDFKGPLPSVSKNCYFLTIIDEHSRFPFAFSCSDMTPKTVIQCLTQLFSIFGMCSYIHSDRFSSFQSYELKSWLSSHGVATSRTTSYNPRGNGQCEKYNGVIWKAVLAALKSRKLPTSHWEVLPDALHSVRSLLCTATNCTLHERMFMHARHSVNGPALPLWLKPGPIFVKKHVRNKDESLVEEVELIECNPTYAHVRLSKGRETTVSVRDIAPRVESNTALPENNGETIFIDSDVSLDNIGDRSASINDCVSDRGASINHKVVNESIDENSVDAQVESASENVVSRRFTRVRKPVLRYGVVPYMSEYSVSDIFEFIIYSLLECFAFGGEE